MINFRIILSRFVNHVEKERKTVLTPIDAMTAFVDFSSFAQCFLKRLFEMFDNELYLFVNTPGERYMYKARSIRYDNTNRLSYQ